ncbi:translesion error-prone DNA polymerase V autoproteolytic subunit [Panacibacter sp. DH6]|uniref:Translesion error-prone DNA polymerase V autoproteolytic subunit n=1 Tax=Panacibacter microcysteis TaxID=2793269 RepID=A0A931E5K5_9BACT|nr:translesion error-prone DNA polymerase V autoproteolytic subunit [Panacibacter microcysteis]MBG9375559.1 translesion error-prone DNA polymerase V autoproteolytic subunit [Panacibacter microcysteis]
MERDQMYNASYSGSKNYTQHHVKTANANGFAAAADDYAERGIDLNEQLILNKPATFFFRMNGDAMTGAGINSGDVLIVDKSIKATNGKIAVVAINGDLMVRRIQQHFNGLTLQSENARYANIEITEFADLNIWGVVTCVIHIFESRLLNHSGTTKQKQKSNTEDYRILY